MMFSVMIPLSFLLQIMATSIFCMIVLFCYILANKINEFWMDPTVDHKSSSINWQDPAILCGIAAIIAGITSAGISYFPAHPVLWTVVLFGGVTVSIVALFHKNREKMVFTILSFLILLFGTFAMSLLFVGQGSFWFIYHHVVFISFVVSLAYSVYKEYLNGVGEDVDKDEKL